MSLTIACDHCGKTLNAPRELAGKRVRCGHCQREFVVPAQPVEAAARALAPGAPARSGPPAEETVSRSMLLPRPGLAPAGVTDELICRLEPGTLRWLDLSEGLALFLGRDRAQIVSTSFLQQVHEDDRALAEDEFRQSEERGERHDCVLRLLDRSGDWRYMRIHTQARYELSGRLDHIRCNLRDVTDRVRGEQELRRRTQKLTAANRQLRLANQKLKEAQMRLVHSEKLAALGTLAAGMAHEINNPLAFTTNNVAIFERDLGFLLEILAHYQATWDDLRTVNPERAATIARRQDEVDLEYVQENLPRLVRSTQAGLGRVAQIVKNLRAFACLDRAEIVDVDVNASIDQALGMMAETLSRVGIEVVRDYASFPPVVGAGADLNQMFLNLLMNAAQAVEATGKPGGRIEVATRRAVAVARPDARADTILVEIADNGCGIAPEVLPKIFDPFFTTKPQGGGPGLGLSLGHGIVADHGGRIEVESTLGAGSRFRVYLPVRRTPPRPSHLP